MVLPESKAKNGKFDPDLFGDPVDFGGFPLLFSVRKQARRTADRRNATFGTGAVFGIRARCFGDRSRIFDPYIFEETVIMKNE